MTPDSDTSNDKELTLADLFGVALGGWKVLLATTLAGALGGLVAAKWMLPVYQADVLLQVDTDQKTPSGALGELQDVFGTSSKAETEIEIVKSRMVLGPVVDSLRLMYQAPPQGALRRLLGRTGRLFLGDLHLPRRTPDDKSPPWTLTGRTDSTLLLQSPEGDSLAEIPLARAFATVFQGDTIRVRVDSGSFSRGETFALAEADPVDVIASLGKRFSVAERGKKTGILSLTLQDRYPDRAARILDEIARSYLRQNIDAKSAEAAKTLEFLRAQLPQVKAKMDTADAALNAYRQARGTVDLTAEAQLSLKQQVDLEQQRLELLQKRQELVRLYKDDHPQVQAIDAQLSRMAKVIGQSNGQVRTLPTTQQEVLKLTRDVTVATNLYQTILGKIQELEVVRAGEVGSVRIIDRALASRFPVKPKRKAILLLGLFAGFALGFAALVLCRTLDRGLRDAASVEKIAQASVFAQIPLCPAEVQAARQGAKVRKLLVHQSPDDLAVESLRSLRTALDFSLLGQGGQILAISGITPGVGKSFVSANLAALFALSGRKVVLVDGDLRRGRLHHHFGGDRSPGLSDVLAGRESLDGVLRIDPDLPELAFVATGKVPPNPSEMLGSPQLGQFLTELRGLFDVVVIDTPPVLLVTDPALVLRHADHASLVLEHGAHGPRDLQEAMKLMRVKPDQPLSLILNKCRDELGAYGGYGKYGRYGRYSRYGKYGKAEPDA